MRVRVVRVGIHKTSSVLALVYGIVFVLMVPFLAILDMTEQEPVPVWVFVLLIPIYVVLVYVVTALACALYNWISRLLGGVELELAETRVELARSGGEAEIPAAPRPEDDDLW